MPADLHSLLTLLREDAAAVLAADLSSMPVLMCISPHDSGLTIGSAVSLAALLDQPSVPRAFHEAAALQPLGRLDSPVLHTLLPRGKALSPPWLAVLAAHDIGLDVILPESGARVMISFDTWLEDPAFADAFPVSLFIPHMHEQQALALAHDEQGACAAVFLALDSAGKGQTAYASLVGFAGLHQPVETIHLHELIGQTPSPEAVSAAAASTGPAALLTASALKKVVQTLAQH
jgi:hypothetical protein